MKSENEEIMGESKNKQSIAEIIGIFLKTVYKSL